MRSILISFAVCGLEYGLVSTKGLEMAKGYSGGRGTYSGRGGGSLHGGRSGGSFSGSGKGGSSTSVTSSGEVSSARLHQKSGPKVTHGDGSFRMRKTGK